MYEENKMTRKKNKERRIKGSDFWIYNKFKANQIIFNRKFAKSNSFGVFL
jgi:hypothetical protein